MFADKELVAAKERQEIELAAQRATLQEQRTHIGILDTALTNAQENVVRLEEEVFIFILGNNCSSNYEAFNFFDKMRNFETPTYYRQ